MAVLVMLLLAACGTAAPTDPGPPVVPSASASASSSSSAAPTPTGAANPEGNHVATGLALVRSPDASSPLTEIFIVEPRGSLRQVTGLGDEPSVGAAGPAWSPDARRIAFGPSVLGSGAFPAVLVVNANGRRQRLIQNLDVEEFSPIEWSADSTQLLYADATPPGDSRIWLADLATGDIQRVGTGARPRFLPGGDRIVFVHGIEGLVPDNPTALTQVVFVMDLDTLKPRRFAVADNAHWSPDGEAVLIEDEGMLILAEPDGSGRRVVANGSLPVWSPDASRFAFLSGTDQDGRSLVSMMDRSGQELWSGVVGSAMTWSSDGLRLAVQVDYPERLVHVLDAHTANLLWETAGSMPDWRP
jgi:Tol biopolymer transport system component